MLSLSTLERFAKKLPLETGAPEPELTRPLTRAEKIAACLAKWNSTNDSFVRKTRHFIVFVTSNDDGEVEFGMKGTPFGIHKETPEFSLTDWTQYQRVKNILEFRGFETKKLKYFASFSETEEFPYYLKDETSSDGCIYRCKVVVIPVLKEEEMTGMNYMPFKTIEKWTEEEKEFRTRVGGKINYIEPESWEILNFVNKKLKEFIPEC